MRRDAVGADDPLVLVRQLVAELIAAEHRLLGADRARLVAGGRDSARALASLIEVAAGFAASAAVLQAAAEGVARVEGSLDDYAPPGRPHIIRWVSADEATIEDAFGALALLRVTVAGAYNLALVREPLTVEDRENLARTAAWAVEEHQRRHALTPGGAAPRRRP